MRQHLERSRKLFWPGMLCVFIALIALVLYVVKGQQTGFTFIYLYGGAFALGFIFLGFAAQNYEIYANWKRNQEYN